MSSPLEVAIVVAVCSGIGVALLKLAEAIEQAITTAGDGES